VPKRDKLNPSGSAKGAVVPKQEPNIVIARSAVGVKDRNPILFINGKFVKAPRAEIALVACLFSELGRVVPYEQLCRAIGHGSSRKRQMHILRQHMMFVRRLLTTHKAGCFLAVTAGVGYALCEVAQG
jgi:DNA-binding response OmpR family regulator